MADALPANLKLLKLYQIKYKLSIYTRKMRETIMKTGKEDEREYASILNEIIKELDGLKICKFDYDI